MNATDLKHRLRADLKLAMQARASDEAKLLRVLIAALDNAEAVPGLQDNTSSRAFGDPSGEVARLELDASATQVILTKERQERLGAAEDYERHGQDEPAKRLRNEADLIARYLD
ncbi:GatB/YqeY domain-containing protein [Croceibacterium sp. LX-88]|uniref:GatB/YqeY domain-containing protein n=1 Tax=Croceibacterium selenioxidans TaxID=2838833 RepID=A0ABS5W6R7_9SPHN|nr:GatB/YqeY domain-containing protein [Croceibacterium selenioxidans]MBT2134802.1 GatB/YqeY domain-containing protein [Croceibacterium selenioxidans]